MDATSNRCQNSAHQVSIDFVGESIWGHLQHSDPGDFAAQDNDGATGHAQHEASDDGSDGDEDIGGSGSLLDSGIGSGAAVLSGRDDSAYSSRRIKRARARAMPPSASNLDDGGLRSAYASDPANDDGSYAINAGTISFLPKVDANSGILFAGISSSDLSAGARVPLLTSEDPAAQPVPLTLSASEQPSSSAIVGGTARKSLYIVAFGGRGQGHPQQTETCCLRDLVPGASTCAAAKPDHVDTAVDVVGGSPRSRGWSRVTVVKDCDASPTHTSTWPFVDSAAASTPHGVYLMGGTQKFTVSDTVA